MLLRRALAGVAAIAAAMLLTPAFAAKPQASPDDNIYANFHAKQLSTLEPIKLADASYKRLAESPRDYSVAVLLTALDPRVACKLCTDFHPEWNVLARSWIRGDKKGLSRLLLGTLDFVDGRETFAAVGF